MNHNAIETVLGAVVLLIAAVFLGFALSASNMKKVSGYNVTANFSKIDGVMPGLDVRVSGVKVGSVEATFLDPKSFQLRAGEENLREYLFNKHAIHHQLCVDCGVDVFARGKKPDGSDVVALNVSCIDGIELSKLKMTPVDGRSM